MTTTTRLLLILALSMGLWVQARGNRAEMSTLQSPGAPVLAADVDFAGAKPATLRLEHDEGVCSATAIEDEDPVPGSHRVLTAAHCVQIGALAMFGLHVADPDKLKSLRLDTRTAKVTKVEFDGSDGAILTTDLYFSHAARFGHRPKQGDVVFSHGNPDGVPDMLIVGRVTGWVDEYFGDSDVMIVDMNCWYGCSGAAVFDAHGQIVGVVNALWPWPQKGWRMTAVVPLRFDEAAVTRS